MTASPEIAALAQEAVRRLTIPGATYRLQFHAGFTFRDALTIVPYLAELGVTHVYASPRCCGSHPPQPRARQ
jgi:(1->4)-alpha-D-glucan 1-alpha-D-glucosylmutase